MNIITAWLLLFLDEEHAFWYLSNLIENILTPGFYIGKSNAMNGFFVEIKVVSKYAEELIEEIGGYKTGAEEFTSQFAT